MKITRTMTIDTNEIQVGDRIEVGHYTATCQALPSKGLALFLLDQYRQGHADEQEEHQQRAATTPAISARS